MSLLHQEEMDDAAKGEELTKGTSHVVIATILAALVVSGAIAWYVLANQKPPLATGQVIAAWVHPQHMRTAAFDASGAPIPVQQSDQILVFAQVRLHNQSRQPLFLTGTAVNATLGDGIHTSYPAGPGMYDQIFLAYPDIPAPHGKALPVTAEIDPGQTLEGEFVSAFKMSKPQWDARKNLNFAFSFRYQPSLVLKPTAPVIEQ